jgi:outer membrane protein assembly factor BamA
LADARRYFFKRPFTFAFRGLHYGRYGRDADNYNQLSPIYLGEETLIRGYGYGSITQDECVVGNDPTSTRCPVFERMLGSRLGVFNAEIRIPVFGTSGFGLINFPYLPLEISPFFDAGIAWTGDQAPQFRFARTDNGTPANCASGTTLQGFSTPCAERIPVFSTGVSFRFNVLGYMILETYVAHPFQRPNKNWVVGVQLAPGW